MTQEATESYKAPDFLFFSLNELSITHGDKISGVIVLVVQQEEIQFDQISLHWTGRERVVLDGNIDKKDILDHRQIVWTSTEKKTLKNGTHTFHFTAELPLNLPSTMEESGMTGTLPVNVPSFLSGISLPYNPITSRNYNASIIYQLTASLDQITETEQVQEIAVTPAVELPDVISSSVAPATTQETTTERPKEETREPSQINPPSKEESTSETPSSSIAEAHPTLPDASTTPQTPSKEEKNSISTSQATATTDEPAHETTETKTLSRKETSVLSSKLDFQVFQRFDPLKVPLETIEKSASKSSFVGLRPVEVRASVPQGGVCFRGHFILLKLAVMNGTNRALDGVHVEIVYVDRYTANKEVAEVRKSVVAGKICEGVAPQGFYVQSLMIDIPNNIPTSITNGSLIERKYELVITVGVPYYTALSLSLPIVVYQASRFDTLPQRSSVQLIPPSPIIHKDEEKKAEVKEEKIVREVETEAVVPTSQPNDA
ncbi:hypothetical protein PROFUN_11450 [Planoprotostelium fungivorum]|uniref:Arrestin C-terminal-like domain-containing protein n=1 Tax=Planoprotostelium fungivorum TaxID=1890364 RepID=A0A2P6N4W2_9EUKA|nr:hypothetical protein PROFUN_11450 [Planoprotostelium fungivorum]